MAADPPVVRALSMHAGYGCRQTGVCCASNWPVPVESDALHRLRAALDDGRLRPAADSVTEPIVHAAGPPGAPAHLLGRTNRRCVFLDGPAPSCRIHSALGHDALPLSCRQFPRITVRDPRSISLTLSHYCPTAAAMLENPAPVTILDAPAGFPGAAEYDGLDASRAMPPLLRPDMLMDWDAWWDLEARAVAVLTGAPPASALGALRVVVDAARQWEPSCGPLGSHIRSCFESTRLAGAPPFHPDEAALEHRLSEIVAATPDAVAAEYRGTLDVRNVTTSAEVASRYLAAHAFANWQIQLGQGLRTWLRSIEAASAMITLGLGVRTADLWLRHLADPNRLATSWSDDEIRPPSSPSSPSYPSTARS